MMFRTVLTLLFLLTVPAQAFAQNGGAYTVGDVKVDIVAASAVKARDQAFAAAQEQAFKMLASRFLPPEQMASFIPPAAETIAGMVADFEITSEQLSKRRYLGNYIFRFKAGSVNRYFGHGPLTGSSAVATRQLLVIPVFNQNGETSLWDVKKNPWLQSWQQNAKDNVALIIPSGNVPDTMDLRQTQPDKITQSGLKRIKARYGAYDTVIASAVFDQSAANILKVDLYRTDRGSVELMQTVPIPVGKATKLGELLSIAVDTIEPILAQNWKIGVQAQQEEILEETVVQDVQSMSQTEAGAGKQRQSGNVNVSVFFTSIGEWLNIRRSLNAISSLQSIRILSLTTNQASMEIAYSDWMGLTSALSARGLSLQSTGPGTYTLVKTTSAGYRQ